VEPYAPPEPFAQGLLDAGDGNRISWEASGNPVGKPALAVHGGRASDPASDMARTRRTISRQTWSGCAST
jgi:hypothetical protein